MDLYIAEKPSLARTLAKHLARGQNIETKKGFINGPGWIMTWCIGHLYELMDAGEYNEAWGSPWRIEALPIIPAQFKYRPVEKTSGQLGIVHSLCSKATNVYHCGDPDREGQYLVDLVINHSCYSGPVYRIWPDDLSPSGLEKVFCRIKPNSEYRSLSLSAQCRSHADWLVGINFSRLYTCLAQAKGYRGTLSLGRGQTAAYALVFNRCMEIEGFKPISHYSLEATFSAEIGEYSGELRIPDELTDDHGYCLDRTMVQSIENAVNARNGLVKDIVTETRTESSPLPFSLSLLQVYCSNKWGYTAKQVLDACQYLYEDLKAITYPRTSCSYLSEGDFKEAGSIVGVSTAAIKLTTHPLAINLSDKPRCYDDSKTTAHTGIIPTSCKPDFSVFDRLGSNERRKKGVGDKSVLENIYKAVATRFISQFLPKHEYQSTIVTTAVKGYDFKSKGTVIINQGWRILLNDDKPFAIQPLILPTVSKGQKVNVKSTTVLDKKTKAPKYFTEGTLIAALSNISEYVDDPKIRQKLKDTDGIGTEATRADFIERIKNIGYIRTENKNLLLTSLGRDVFPSIPSFFKTAAMTAIWESALQGIAESRLDHNAFNRNIASWTETQLTKLKESPPEVSINIDDKYKCESCGSPLIRKKGKFGYFWPCSSRECNTSYKDYKMAPLYPLKGDGNKCPECKKEGRDGVMHTRIRKENREKGIPASVFLGCNKYPACRYAEWKS